MEMYPQCIPRNFSSLVGLCSVFRRCMAGRLNAESIEISSKARIAKAPEVAFRGQFLELMEGVEPSTFSLRMRCSAIKLHQHIICGSTEYNRAAGFFQSINWLAGQRASLPVPVSFYLSESSSFGAPSETV